MSDELVVEKEDRGYLILAMQDFEYEQAAALAYSIKIHNKDASVAIVTNYMDRIPHHHHDVFDYMIDLPYGSNETTGTNEWQLYWCTPYVHSMIINCSSLVKENHDSAWEYLIDHHDICFFPHSTDFKGNALVNKKLNVLWAEYRFNTVHSNMYYFKHDTDVALAYFKLADVFMQNWREVFAHYFKEQHKPAYYSNDIMHSIINTIVLHDEVLQNKKVIETVNMPITLSDGVIGIWDKWTDRLNVWSSKGAKVKIQNFAMSTNLYYGEQEFLTEEILNEHRDTYRITAKR